MTNHRLISAELIRKPVARPGRGSGPRARRAFTIVELVGTCFLMGIMLTVTVPMLLVVARERRALEQRQFALQHLENLLERTVSHPGSDLTIGKQELPEADADLLAILPGMERSLVIKPIEGEQSAQLVVASIRWQTAQGGLNRPMQLSAWIYPTKGGRREN